MIKNEALIKLLADQLMLTHGAGLDWDACARAAIDTVIHYLQYGDHAD